MTRQYNFCAGPAMLPDAVLERAAAEMLDWHGTGMSFMEMSHRSPEVVSVVAAAEASLRPVDPPATSPAPPLGPPVAVETEAAPPAARMLGPAETAPAPASNSSAPAVPSPRTVAERP